MLFLVIQTAFLGDVILATSVIEELHKKFPGSTVDFLLRKGNEGVLKGHPFVKNVWTLDKGKNKIRNILALAGKVKTCHYDHVINLNRFGSSGFLTWRSGAKEKSGFGKNPFSFCYTNKVKHEIGNGKHETERNHGLIQRITGTVPSRPKLYPSPEDYSRVQTISGSGPFLCIAPASVWFTKQFPKEKWVELINTVRDKTVFLLGGNNDAGLCEEIIRASAPSRPLPLINLAGKLSVLETAALMQHAAMNYVNDSAPLHIASAMNAPVTAIFCSTVPAFGFGPLSDNSIVVETKEKLDCRPCGLHGHAACPQGHFKCAVSIAVKDIVHV